MSQHSPGPWKLYQILSASENDKGWRIFSEARGIAEVYPLASDATPEGIANAQLIAAAPDLLKALKAVLPEMRREHDKGDGHFSTAEVEAAEASLKKAEGS